MRHECTEANACGLERQSRERGESLQVGRIWLGPRDYMIRQPQAVEAQLFSILGSLDQRRPRDIHKHQCAKAQWLRHWALPSLIRSAHPLSACAAPTLTAAVPSGALF